MRTQIDAPFPEKLGELFRHHRYKVLHGGRGGGKSWAIARALLLLGFQRKLRILCTRETQRSIRDSVHKLLVDQIAALGLIQHYRIQQVQITGTNGTEFIFAGISDETAASLKSSEAIDICWVEEGQVVSENSWTILLPTLFRKAGCELWVSFNPQLDSDPTWKRFVETPPPDTWRCEINWKDNPFFPEPLNEARIHDANTRPLYDYEWIWEGKCRPAVSGAVYADQMAELAKGNRIGDYPVSAFLPVYAAADLGWNDRTAVVIGQRQGSAIRIIDYLENHHKGLDWYSGELRARPYAITEIILPHDGAHNHLTGASAQRILEDLGWRVRVLPNTPVETGIEAVRVAFKSLYFNYSDAHKQREKEVWGGRKVEQGMGRLLDCMRRYRRIIPVTTNEPSTPAHDEYSHGADAVRYFVLAAPEMGEPFNNDGGGMRLKPLEWKWKIN